MLLASDSLTPGVLDGYAERAFTQGACGALALAINQMRGWPIWAITDSHNVFDGEVGGGSALHWVVMHPNGKLLDVDGFHDVDDLVERYHGEADDGEAAAGRSSREDCREWYVESQGEPISVRLACSFVNAVVERAESRLAHEPDGPCFKSDPSPTPKASRMRT